MPPRHRPSRSARVLRSTFPWSSPFIMRWRSWEVLSTPCWHTFVLSRHPSRLFWSRTAAPTVRGRAPFRVGQHVGPRALAFVNSVSAVRARGPLFQVLTNVGSVFVRRFNPSSPRSPRSVDTSACRHCPRFVRALIPSRYKPPQVARRRTLISSALFARGWRT
jgi:hypothetical protein